MLSLKKRWNEVIKAAVLIIYIYGGQGNQTPHIIQEDKESMEQCQVDMRAFVDSFIILDPSDSTMFVPLTAKYITKGDVSFIASCEEK